MKSKYYEYIIIYLSIAIACAAIGLIVRVSQGVDEFSANAIFWLITGIGILAYCVLTVVIQGLLDKTIQLMMGENHELKNITMVFNAPQQLTEQVPNKLAEQLSIPLSAIVKAIGTEQCSLKVIMERIGLKHRPTFIANYLVPAIQSGFVIPLYPNSPKHPKQKYLLTAKGLAIYSKD